MTKSIEIMYAGGDVGDAYYAKGHIDFTEFMGTLACEVDPDDRILKETPEHLWMRKCRDFQDGETILATAKPNSRGAFKCTWLQGD